MKSRYPSFNTVHYVHILPSMLMVMILITSRLAHLELFSKQVETALGAAGAGVLEHLHDPVNAFQLVNRYSNGWMKLHDKVYQDNAQGRLVQCLKPVCFIVILCYSSNKLALSERVHCSHIYNSLCT